VGEGRKLIERERERERESGNNRVPYALSPIVRVICCFISSGRLFLDKRKPKWQQSTKNIKYTFKCAKIYRKLWLFLYETINELY